MLNLAGSAVLPKSSLTIKAKNGNFESNSAYEIKGPRAFTS